MELSMEQTLGESDIRVSNFEASFRNLEINEFRLSSLRCKCVFKGIKYA
jgi:hypothetical protein